MKSFDELLANNQEWAANKLISDPEYFKRLSQDQKPNFLWIGCSDSRVPAELVVNAKPGEIFVHRNIANQMVTTDFNSLSVLQYAVQVLKVKHVVVCGHYNCGGVKAALNKQNIDLMITNKWLDHIKDVYRLHKPEIEALPSYEAKVNRLVELNVIEQINRLSHISIIQQAWRQNEFPVLHGCVYGLEDGLIKKLITLDADSAIDSVYKYEFAD
jgi:carbonic anhydrase